MTDAPILLAEDNPDDVLLTRQAFAKSGFANPITAVPDGEACLALLLPGSAANETNETDKANETADTDTADAADAAGDDPEHDRPEHGALRPALLLLDINLPKIGGLEVLRRLRADRRTRALPVVILTTSQERRDIVNGYLLGANSYVCKPISFTRFVALVSTLGTYWLSVNEPCPSLGGC